MSPSPKLTAYAVGLALFWASSAAALSCAPPDLSRALAADGTSVVTGTLSDVSPSSATLVTDQGARSLRVVRHSAGRWVAGLPPEGRRLILVIDTDDQTLHLHPCNSTVFAANAANLRLMRDGPPRVIAVPVD